MFNKKLFLLILCSSSLLLIAGLTSELSLGDEILHYRFAKDIFKADRRVAFDPVYGTGNPPGYFYNSAPLWHTLLALFWKLFGRVSFTLAQLYHTIYYVLLLLFTYLLAKELYGKRQGLYSALIIATVPAVISFSILFYLDIPATTLSILCLLLIVKRKFIWSGIVLGLMWFTKMNTFLFVPAFIFLVIYQTKSNIRENIKSLFCFFIPAFLIIFPDLLWRENNLKSTITITLYGKKILVPTTGALEGIKFRFNWNLWKIKLNEYSNSSLLNPLDIVKYLGIVLLISLVIYLLLKIYKKRDLILWLPVICYFLLFCYLFHSATDIRYLLPIIPLLAIISSKAIVNYSHKKWIKILIIILCILQFSATVLYVREKRQIPKAIKEGISYLRDNTPPDALVIYPEYVILESANRRITWAGNIYNVLENLFWNKDENKIKNLLKSNNIDYIVIKKSRIYDDSKVHHYGGYPKSFVERLPSLSFVKLVFDNKEMSIWRIHLKN